MTSWVWTILRAYPNNRIVMRPSEKSEANAAGQKGSEAWFCHVENIFGRQRRHRALQPEFTLDVNLLAFLSRAIERVIWIGS